jgi:phage-related tail fiber protein
MRKNARWASGARLYTARGDGLATSLGLRRAGATDENQPDGIRGEAQLMAGLLELRREVLGVSFARYYLHTI